MKLLDLIGAAAGIGVIIALLGFVVFVDCQHRQQIDRLSTAVELPHGDAPVPVYYPTTAVA